MINELFWGEKQFYDNFVQNFHLSDNKMKNILQKQIKMHKNIYKNMKCVDISDKGHFVRNITGHFSFCC